MGINIRKVKRAKAKDYQRGAKYFDYYYIIVNKKHIVLNKNGWSEGQNISIDSDGSFVVLNENKYYLDYSNI